MITSDTSGTFVKDNVTYSIQQPTTAFGNISKSLLQVTFTAAGIIAAGYLLEWGRYLFSKHEN
jgi:hypothetical protein